MLSSRRADLGMTLIGMLLILWLGLKVGAVLDLKQEIAEHPRADQMVEYDGSDMTFRHMMEHYGVPERLSWLDGKLFGVRTSTLWAALYVLGGLGGGVAAMWLRMAGFRFRDDLEAPGVAGILASGVAGGLAFLLMRLPVRFFGEGIHLPNLGGNEGTGLFALYDRLLPFAVLAGLFAALFFRAVEGRFGKQLGNEGE